MRLPQSYTRHTWPRAREVRRFGSSSLITPSKFCCSQAVLWMRVKLWTFCERFSFCVEVVWVVDGCMQACS